MPFLPESEIRVKELDDDPANWELLKEIVYQGNTQSFTAKVGDQTDFASVPRFFVWFLPRYGRYTKAAVIHDHLWRVEVPKRNVTLPEADAIFRRAMRELDVSFLQRWLLWAAVRLGALMKPGGRKRWLRDSWAVFPLLLVGLPIVVPPAILIAIALLLFTVLEAFFYVTLKVSQSIKRRVAPEQPQKEVNPPQLSLKT